jgi:hypothetical protein
MQEGGIAGSDVTQEPVTGNEVPPGAMPSEVRDDVPAQLSEGEYVVPADVVRFFGVKYFEDLRSQAKQGLSAMQANGRIGGATVDGNGIPMGQQEEEEELTPEEEQMLNEALGKTGMADGGDVPFDRTTFTLDQPTSNLESRKYIDPKTGAIQNFNFSFGTPTELIPTNFVPWTQALEDAAKNVTAPVVKVPEPKKESWADTHPAVAPTTDGTTGGPNKWATENYDAISSDPFKYGMAALEDDTGKLAGQVLTGAAMIPAVTGPALVGAAVVKTYNAVENIANARASMMVMKAQGRADTEEYKALNAATDAMIEKLPTAQQTLVEANIIGSGKNLYKKYEEEQSRRTGGGTGGTQGGGTVGNQGGDKTNKGGTVGNQVGGTVGNQGNKDKKSDSSNVGYTPGKVDPGLAKAVAAVTPPKATVSNGAIGSTSTQTKSTTKAPANAGSTRFKEGGLVTRGTKTAHKTKGLAGKQ